MNFLIVWQLFCNETLEKSTLLQQNSVVCWQDIGLKNTTDWMSFSHKNIHTYSQRLLIMKDSLSSAANAVQERTVTKCGGVLWTSLELINFKFLPDKELYVLPISCFSSLRVRPSRLGLTRRRGICLRRPRRLSHGEDGRLEKLNFNEIWPRVSLRPDLIGSRMFDVDGRRGEEGTRWPTLKSNDSNMTSGSKWFHLSSF